MIFQPNLARQIRAERLIESQAQPTTARGIGARAGMSPALGIRKGALTYPAFHFPC